MTDQLVREHIRSLVEQVPHRSGDLDAVLKRGRRRAIATRAASASVLIVFVLATVGVAAFLSRGNSDADVADSGGVADLELMDGLVVDVVPGPVESEGALVYRGVLGPEPRFDTTSLGTEIPLEHRNPSEFVVPTSSNPLESNALQAPRLVYLGDINGAQIALHVFTGGSRGQLCVYLGNGTEVAGGGSCDIPGGPITHSNVDPPIGSWTVWSHVPAETSVVQMVLADGSTYWQRPTSRTVLFNLVDGRPLGTPALFALDADGQVILAVEQSD